MNLLVASWPARWARLLAFNCIPVVPWWREDLDEHGAVRTGTHLMRHVGEDAPARTGCEVALLIADAKGERAFEDHSDLLVVVAVLRNEASRVKLDQAEGDPL